jgi:hypothetical protein
MFVDGWDFDAEQRRHAFLGKPDRFILQKDVCFYITGSRGIKQEVRLVGGQILFHSC